MQRRFSFLLMAFCISHTLFSCGSNITHQQTTQGGAVSTGGGDMTATGGAPAGGTISAVCDLNSAATSCTNADDGCYVRVANLDFTTGAYKVTCETAGKVEKGGACQPMPKTLDEACAPGGLCLYGRCSKMCLTGSNAGCDTYEVCITGNSAWSSNLGLCVQPCSLSKQDCVDPNRSCYATGQINNGVIEGECALTGKVAVTGACVIDSEKLSERCVKGAQCFALASGSKLGRCQQFCGADGNAPVCSVAGEGCIILDDEVGLCKKVDSCSVLTQDCQDKGTVCYPLTTANGTFATMCEKPGSRPVGGACNYTTECVKGALCTKTNLVTRTCVKMCGLNNSAPLCETPGQACVASPKLPGFGVCQ